MIGLENRFFFAIMEFMIGHHSFVQFAKINYHSTFPPKNHFWSTLWVQVKYLVCYANFSQTSKPISIDSIELLKIYFDRKVIFKIDDLKFFFCSINQFLTNFNWFYTSPVGHSFFSINPFLFQISWFFRRDLKWLINVSRPFKNRFKNQFSKLDLNWESNNRRKSALLLVYV